MWLCSGSTHTCVLPHRRAQPKECTDYCLCFPALWLQMYLTLRDENCSINVSICQVCVHVCICMCTHVFVCKSHLSAPAKNTEHFICAGNQGHHMLAFLGLPKNYITGPQSQEGRIRASRGTYFKWEMPRKA